MFLQKRTIKQSCLPEEPPGDIETGEIADEKIEDDETVANFWLVLFLVY